MSNKVKLFNGQAAIFGCYKNANTGKPINRLLAIADTYDEASDFVREQASGIWSIKKYDGKMKLGDYENKH